MLHGVTWRGPRNRGFGRLRNPKRTEHRGLPTAEDVVLVSCFHSEFCVLSKGHSELTPCYLFNTPPGTVRRTDLDATRLGYWAGLRRLRRNPSYLVVLGSYLLIAASFAIQAYYSPPRLLDLGLARAWIGPIQSVGVIWEILLFRWRSIIVNRLGYSGSVLIGCLALVVRQLLFAYTDNLWLLAASYLLVGTTVVLYHIGVSLLVEAIAGREVKSTAQTLLVLCSSGLGPMLANGAVAWLAPGVRPDLSGVLLFGAGLAGGATLLILARGRKLVP